MRIVIIGGGRGTRSLLEAIWSCSAGDGLRVSSITMLLNAYDNAASTGEVRRLFGILGPSDPRKNLQALLDPAKPGYTALYEFFGMRFGNEEDADEGQEEHLLQAMARANADVLSGYRKGQVFLELPEGFRSLVAEGLNRFLAVVAAGGTSPNYRDFSVANALFAGLAGRGGSLQAALDRIQPMLPLRGRVVLNSLESLYLYGVQEYAPAGEQARVLAEGEIVALRSSARIKSILLLPRPLEGENALETGGLSPGAIEQRLRRLAAPVVNANPEALRCLAAADLVLYGPGTLHSSLLPTYLTAGLAAAIAANQSARKVLVCNIGEDLDIPGYTAADIHRLSLHYLTQSDSGRAGFQPWDFFTDILVNLPRSDRRNSVQPNVGYFEALDYCGVCDGQEGSSHTTGRTETRVVVTDLEDEASPGRHAVSKLAALLPKLLTGLPGWHARFLEELTRGAIIFDVDETILDVRVDRHQKRYEQTLIEAPVLHLLVELLEAGFRLCAITGNDMRGFEARFTQHLVHQLRQRDQLNLIERFEAYADGAARHATFHASGTEFQVLPDHAYNGAHGITNEEFDLIRTCLDSHAKRPGLIPSPAELGQTYDLGIWKYRYDEAQRRWFEETETGESRPVPRVHERGDRVMLTLKPLPSRRHMLPGVRVDRDIRREALERIRADLRQALGTRADDYLIREAGWGSIDVTRGVSKATAVQHFMQTWKLRPQDILYFGNEFGIRGNDRPVALGIPGVHVVSVNQPETEVFYQRNIFYGGGRGTASTMQQLGDILERFREALATARRRSPPLREVNPVIQEKIEALYREKLARHESTLHRRRDVFVDRCFAHASRLAVLDSLIRLEGAGRITLIIPAGGPGSRLQADRPKPLFEVAGKPAFLYALEAFSPFADRIAVVVSPEAERAVAALLEQRPEPAQLVVQPTPEGDWEAVKLAFDALQPVRGHVIVAWADLVITNPQRIRETIDAHLASENALTFPTAFERRPYAAVLRSSDLRPADVSFRNEELGGEEGYLEHDCSFFIFRAPALGEVLRHLELEHTSRGKTNSPVRFVDGIRILHQLGHPVQALPICRQGEFLGFNESAEAAQISALINRTE